MPAPAPAPAPAPFAASGFGSDPFAPTAFTPAPAPVPPSVPVPPAGVALERSFSTDAWSADGSSTFQ
eukprot:scaffold70624_cov39-Phaeocystis_antarctica.AAC.1